MNERKTRTLFRSVTVVALTTMAILLIPLIAMQFTEEVAWSAGDFLVAGGLLFGAGILYVLAATRGNGNLAYRVAVGIAVVSTLLLVWANLAVGLIGSEDNPANLMYGGVLGVFLVGSVAARLRPGGMAVTLFAMALTQTLIAAIAVTCGLGQPANGPLELIFSNAFFVVLFAAAGLLFLRAERERALQLR